MGNDKKITQSKAHCLSPSEIEARLESSGIQPTAQRIAICRYVLCEADHPTADQVKEWADRNFPKMSLATVYNTLGTLVKAGLLKELRFAHSESVIYDNNISQHHHFFDEKTGELLDLPPEKVGVELHQKLNQEFKIKQVDILIRGERR